MLLLLSPAKALDYETPVPDVGHSQPRFVRQAAELIGLLRQKSQREISELMNLSDALSELNVARYQAWSPRFTARNSRPAVLAFNGDVYGGLAARTLSPDDLDWAQQHLAILSGLHGVLRPLDRIQPYRLEMGTALENPLGKNLYQFWGQQLAEHLNQQLRADKTPVLINLASKEYFKAVDQKALKVRVIECVFEEYKSGQYKIVSFMAKRARGLMARFAITQRLLTPGQLEGFREEAYRFDAKVSQENRLVFRRKGAAA